MARRRRQRLKLADVQARARGAYFLSPPSSFTFVHSGAKTLDRVLGGGWPLSRVSNIVGDKSTGKTLLAIEAMTNFADIMPKRVKARYAETEAAFDEGYAQALGMPLNRVSRPKRKERIETVEDFYYDLQEYIRSSSDGGLYILDSLDALSDDAEIDRELDKATYGAAKAKMMSQIFRRINGKVQASNVHLMVISQTRANIGVAFGKTYSRSGGKALDFYASQILYLAHKGEISFTRHGVKRSVGVDIKVKCTKNKIGMPFRTCNFPILFGYGIEDICASINWLLENKQWDACGRTKADLQGIYKAALHSELETEQVALLREELDEAVGKAWKVVEGSFIPPRGKYS